VDEPSINEALQILRGIKERLETHHNVMITDGPSINEALQILRGIKERLETHHNVMITDGALVAAAKLSDRYITDRFLPDKAIDLQTLKRSV